MSDGPGRQISSTISPLIGHAAGQGVELSAWGSSMDRPKSVEKSQGVGGARQPDRSKSWETPTRRHVQKAPFPAPSCPFPGFSGHELRAFPALPSRSFAFHQRRHPTRMCEGSSV